jgi:phosphatidylglycerophosphatase A
LQKNPAGFADLEKKVHHAFQQMADQLVAGLLAQATKGDDFADNAKKK